MIRQPIVSVLGHIDHGKTSLLDRIRGSTIAAKEAGHITQHIGATEVPISAVKNVCGPLLDRMNIKLSIPGLLFIDTPGHAAFVNLRRRGGSISDIAILVVDVKEGFNVQTYESLNILKTYKTPFIVAANKIDLIPGWRPQKGMCFMDSFKEQKEDLQQTLDIRIYEIVKTLYEHGFNSERFDRVRDFTNQIAVIPLSAKTGEGVQELLAMLSGLAQRFLEKQLKTDVKGPGKGSILEVKKTEGLGTTLDVILYDGTIKKGDIIVVGSAEAPIVTTVKALLKPLPLEEIRVGNKFENVDEVYAAAGIKIAAPNLENALAGAPVYVAQSEADIGLLESQIKAEIEEVQIRTEKKGVIVKADTLGSLEAIVKMLEEEGITVRSAGFGGITRADVKEADAVRRENPVHGVIFAFNLKTSPEIQKEIDDFGIKLFAGDVVYSLIEDYKTWYKTEAEQSKDELFKRVVTPAKIRLKPGYVFRQSKPAICGAEIQIGTLKPRTTLINEKGVEVGEVREIQKESKVVNEAKAGSDVALSIQGAVIGRNVNEGDVLFAKIPLRDQQLLKTKLAELLSREEMELLKVIEKLVK
ncbi:TPA: translation initiation factor IF-2 [archaeon]|nr:translation initiation factor IF-2 [Candidatus Naiadarchaeales archaeon SRR2090159.bin1288]